MLKYTPPRIMSSTFRIFFEFCSITFMIHFLLMLEKTSEDKCSKKRRKIVNELRKHCNGDRVRGTEALDFYK